ncbi:MAG: TolC family protein [Acidobacteria bacterium]|nr:TolC family protein [Acidobacteriota bacterium]
MRFLILALSVSAEPFTTKELLDSVDRSFPLIEAALQERQIADGVALTAQGEFDLKLKAEAESQQFGFYRNETFKGLFEQNTAAWGTTVWGGYRIGRGTYGPYDEKALTLRGGEMSGGFRTPLTRNRAIDARRTDLQSTRLGQEGADFFVQKERLKIYKTAVKQYWDWVAAGRQLQVARNLLLIAEQRNSQIEEQVKLGQLAPVELTDNQRAILQRRSAVVNAERALQNATIELSLFWRDGAGNPLQVEPEQLPGEFPSPAPLPVETERDDLALAMHQRPEIRSLLIKRQQQTLETRLAANQLQPQVDFFFNYSRDLGEGRLSRRGNEIEAGFLIEQPLQRRKALGKQQQANAKLSIIEADLRFARDRVLLDVQDAASAVRAAHDAVGFIRDEVKAAIQLEDAERTRFDLGDSTQFFVNLRELATAEAAFREIKALADYQKARNDYQAATARLLTVR